MYRLLLSHTAVLLASVLLLAEASRAEGMFPGETWERATPESQGLDSARLKAAVDYMDQQFGPDGAKELVIIRNGYLIWEGPQADAYHPIWSCTKTFASTVLGLLVEDGRCTLDTRAMELEVHLADEYPLYSRIKLRDLAAMCGGYQGEVRDVREDQPWGDPMAFLSPREPYFEAGTTVQYNDHDVFLLGKSFYWWVNGTMADGRRPWPSAPPKTYTAHGKGCNFCYVIPEWNMVVVRMGTVPISTGNIAQGDRLCDEFFRRLAAAVKASEIDGDR